MYEIYQNRKNSNNILFVTRLKFQQEDLHNEIQDSKSNFCPRITHKSYRENLKSLLRITEKVFEQ